jgi:acyl dehydratase
LTTGAELIGKSWPPATYEIGREKIREYATAVGETNPIYFQPDEAVRAGFSALAAPPMFCAVYCAPAMARAAFDPALGIDRARLVHGEQDFEWAEPVCAGDAITTTCELADVHMSGANAFYVFDSISRNQDGEETLRARYTGIVRGPKSRDADAEPATAARAAASPSATKQGLPGELSPGHEIPEFKFTPDKYVPFRYAGASGDFTPIHIDADFARAVGLPGIILHGLYTMALVARGQVEAAGGDPRALRRLRVQFRGVALPEIEISVGGRVKEVVNGTAVIETWAAQAGRRIVRNAESVLTTRRT